MFLFFDTEFTGLKKDTELISLGIISEDNREIYIEIKDVNLEDIDNWITVNVLKNTVWFGHKNVEKIVQNKENYYYCTKEEARVILSDWLEQFDSVQLVSDVSHYDMVLFLDIFGGALNIPENLSPACHDINQDIAKWLGIPESSAFISNREDFLHMNGKNVEGFKHNSLYDAKVIKEIFNTINLQ